MSFEKGKGKTGGRQKGTPNKSTASAREAFQYAFDKAGGQERLAQWGKANPGEFYRLYARLIPQDLNVGGQENNPLKVLMERAGEEVRALDLKQLLAIKDILDGSVPSVH